MQIRYYNQEILNNVSLGVSFKNKISAKACHAIA